jgi:hypothetical protein
MRETTKAIRQLKKLIKKAITFNYLQNNNQPAMNPENINPILEAALSPEMKKLVDTGIYSGSLKLTGFGEKVLMEVLAVQNQAELVKHADRLLKDEKKS